MTKAKKELTKENLVKDMKAGLNSAECAKEYRVHVATIRKAHKLFGITESFAKKKAGRKSKIKNNN